MKRKFSIGILVVLVISQLVLSCDKEDEVPTIEKFPANVGSLQEFNIRFGFITPNTAISADLIFQETSSWEVTCMKEIASVWISHNDGQKIEHIDVSDGNGQTSEKITFEENNTYSVYASDDKDKLKNSFLVHFKRLSSSAGTKHFSSYPKLSDQVLIGKDSALDHF
jgi:hypothetical protein